MGRQISSDELVSLTILDEVRRSKKEDGTRLLIKPTDALGADMNLVPGKEGGSSENQRRFTVGFFRLMTAPWRNLSDKNNTA